MSKSATGLKQLLNHQRQHEYAREVPQFNQYADQSIDRRINDIAIPENQTTHAHGLSTFNMYAK